MKSTGREGKASEKISLRIMGTLTAIAALGRNMAAMKPVAANIPAMTSGCTGLGGAPENGRRRGRRANQSVSSAEAAGSGCTFRVRSTNVQGQGQGTYWNHVHIGAICPLLDRYARVQLTLRTQDVLYEVTVLIKCVERLKRSGEMVSISWKRGRMFA